MKVPYLTCRPNKGGRLLRPWLAVQVVIVALTCAPLLSGAGAYLYVSESASVGSNGTLYATGVTNAGGMQVHSATVTINITSPKGRLAHAYGSVSSGGYAVATASLAFDTTDLGEYLSYVYGSGW